MKFWRHKNFMQHFNKLQSLLREARAELCLPSDFPGGAHRIMGCFGLEGTFRGHLAHPPAMSRDPFHQPRPLRAPSNLALNVPRDGASTSSLGNPFQGFTTLMVNNFFLLSSVNLPSLGCASAAEGRDGAGVEGHLLRLLWLHTGGDQAQNRREGMRTLGCWDVAGQCRTFCWQFHPLTKITTRSISVTTGHSHS